MRKLTQSVALKVLHLKLDWIGRRIRYRQLLDLDVDISQPRMDVEANRNVGVSRRETPTGLDRRVYDLGLRDAIQALRDMSKLD